MEEDSGYCGLQDFSIDYAPMLGHFAVCCWKDKVLSKQALPMDVYRATPGGASEPTPEIPQVGIITAAEFRFILLFTLGLCAVSSIPYVIGHLATFPGSVFTDVLAYETDANNYLAYAHQAASGAWLFHNPMTSELHGSVFFNFEWLLMGKMAALFHLSLGSAMNVLRLLFTALMCFEVYWLSTYLLLDIFLRRSALIAVMAGGGFGWLALLISHVFHISLDSSYFLDLKAGLFPFFSTLLLPHFLVAGAFATLGMCLFLRAERDPRVSSYAGTGLFYMLAGACRPYDMIYLIAATGLYLGLSFWRNKESRWELVLRAVPILMCVPLVGYYYWIFRIHPIFRWWSLPGRVPAAPWALAFSFGISFFLLCFAAWSLRGERLGQAGTLMVCCLISAVALVYPHRLFHFSFQFATDILVPLVMVVFLGLERPLTEWDLKDHWAHISIMAVLAVNSLTSAALTTQAVRLALRGNYRIDQRLLEAYSWLDRHSKSNELVLADFENSNRIPQYAHNRVFCGYTNTVRFGEKKDAVDMFFASGTSNAFREGLLQQNAIVYVLLSREEAAQLVQISNASFLHEVFTNDAAAIYATAAR